MNLSSDGIKQLLDQQLGEWQLAKTNYDALANVESKDFSFGSFVVRVQFNPARIQSSNAKVDAKSIQERKCFLCTNNLPEVQKGISFKDEYQVLVNPFPIFPEHFTIPTYQHVDQLIKDRYADMLDLTKKLDNYSFFYNGPKCGASAPDHAHFQAGNKGFLPIEKDIHNVEKQHVYKAEGIAVYTLQDYLRQVFVIEAEDRDASVQFFQKLYKLLEVKAGEQEPMMNLVAWYEDGKYISCVLPRERHRPTCFFAEGDANILISPAAVDFGGVFITPLEKDFNKITADDLKNILEEVSISEEKVKKIVAKLK